MVTVKRSCFLSLLITVSIMMSGCGNINGAGMAISERIGEYFKNAEEIQTQVLVFAEFPERVSEYRVKYTYSKNNDDIIEIIKPESVSGIKIHIKENSTELEFDGMRLETGEPGGNGLTPLNALPWLFEQWSEGHVKEIERQNIRGEKNILIIHSSNDEETEIEYRTWFSEGDLSPIYSEIFCNNRCVIKCEYETFSSK